MEILNGTRKTFSKLIVMHIAMSIFGLIMSIATRMLAENTSGSLVLYYIVGALAIGMYLMIIYVDMWELGAADKIKIDGGRYKYRAFKGMLVLALANIPTIIFGACATISCYMETKVIKWLGFMSPLYNGMYTIFTDKGGLDLSAYFPPVYILLCIPAIIVGFISYILGAKGFKCLFPEPKKKQDEHTR